MVAILDPLAIGSVRMTVDEYLEADLPEGYCYELVNGEIEVTPTPGVGHDRVIDEIARLLFAFRQQHPDRIEHISFRATLAILGKESAREPDIAVYSQWPSESVSKKDERKLWKKLTPRRVIEIVSIGGEARNYRQKREDYWLAGVEEYWIADRHSAMWTVLTRGDREWTERVFHRGETLESASFPDLCMDGSGVLKL